MRTTKTGFTLFVIWVLSIDYCQSQEFSGSWIMAYMRAKQPVFTMIQQDGELTLEDETPQDSTIIQSSALMLMTAVGGDSAVSYSWDGEERWAIERLEGQLRFNGVRDSLYGNYDQEGRLVLASTIDTVPTEYIFESLSLRNKKQKLDIIDTRWKVEGDAGLLSNQQFVFQQDSLLTTELEGRAAFGEYYIHPLGRQNALELVVNQPDNFMGIIYLTRVSRRRMYGVLYAVIDDETRPKKYSITLRR